jgi:large subunit ribosomal protein L22
MEAKAVAWQVRISATKVRQVLTLIRGKSASDAAAILRHTPKKAARTIEKVLRSAVANAEHNFGMDVNKLKVVQAAADAGVSMKRFRPVSMGRAHAFRRHTSHVTVVVAEE